MKKQTFFCVCMCWRGGRYKNLQKLQEAVELIEYLNFISSYDINSITYENYMGQVSLGSLDCGKLVNQLMSLSSMHKTEK